MPLVTASPRRLFLSYAHDDHATAERLARALLDKGQDVWWDGWEIAAGDSLIQKIFSEGLAEAAGFVVLLSNASVRSKWVREELDTATLRRIEDLTRVIPVIIDDAEIPLALRTLKWVDLRRDFDSGVRQILNAVHGVSEKPALGPLPVHLAQNHSSIGGLSPLATSVGLEILGENPADSEQEHVFEGPEIAGRTSLTPLEVNDAVDELESAGVVSVIRTLGTAPYAFFGVEPTYLLYHAFASVLDYSPSDDVKSIIAAVAALGKADGPRLQAKTGLKIGRLNKGVDYLREYGLADVRRYLGTRPYRFGQVDATRRTRQEAEALN